MREKRPRSSRDRPIGQCLAGQRHKRSAHVVTRGAAWGAHAFRGGEGKAAGSRGALLRRDRSVQRGVELACGREKSSRAGQSRRFVEITSGVLLAGVVDMRKAARVRADRGSGPGVVLQGAEVGPLGVGEYRPPRRSVDEPGRAVDRRRRRGDLNAAQHPSSAYRGRQLAGSRRASGFGRLLAGPGVSLHSSAASSRWTDFQACRFMAW